MIRFEHVTKEYAPHTVVVDDLCLTIPTGQITVLVGPSGCGKTTTLRMINRMVNPTTGIITIDGRNVAEGDPAVLRRGIGYVIQHGGLFPHRTVMENIATVPRLLGWDRARSRRAACDWLERVGLSADLADRFPRQLSGGQQQRVGVARALAADPPIVLMDEPFSAVDPVVRQQLQRELVDLQHELGKTIVFVTHDIDEALLLGSQVAVLEVGGRVAQMASPAELLAAPVDGFVADFLGRDRGIRSLSFQQLPSLSLRTEPTMVLGQTPLNSATRQQMAQGWHVVLNQDGQPLGWVDAHQHRGPVRAEDVNRSGVVAPLSGSPREALDAALSSPCGRGVMVDAHGVFQGTVRATDILAALDVSQDAS